MTCPETITIGAFVLGALDASERHPTQEHLETCATCREALLQFAQLPGLLHAVPLEDIQLDEPIESGIEAVPATTSVTEIHDSATAVRRARWVRRAVVGAMGVVVFGVVGVVGWESVLGAGPRRPPGLRRMAWGASTPRRS